MSMDLSTKPGETVIFANPMAGYEFDIKRADKYLTIGNRYTVRKMVVRDWSSEVYLQGFKKPFNSCLFENVSELSK